jgi:hypothetical protein
VEGYDQGLFVADVGLSEQGDHEAYEPSGGRVVYSLVESALEFEHFWAEVRKPVVVSLRPDQRFPQWVIKLIP